MICPFLSSHETGYQYKQLKHIFTQIYTVFIILADFFNIPTYINFMYQLINIVYKLLFNKS